MADGFLSPEFVPMDDPDEPGLALAGGFLSPGSVPVPMDDLGGGLRFPGGGSGLRTLFSSSMGLSEAWLLVTLLWD